MAFIVWSLTACSPKSPIFLAGATMGTTYSVKISDSIEDSEDLQNQIDAQLQRINDLMSTYIPDSELSKFNQSEIDIPFSLSRENAEVFAMAKKIHGESNGQFDVTIGPLVNLWGFGPNNTDMLVPSNEEIKAAKAG